MTIVELTWEQVRLRCDPAGLALADGAGLPATDAATPEIFGQERALNSLDFGLSIDAAGYNIFVVGANGTGRSTAVDRQISRAAAALPPAADYVYVHNFDNPRAPIALSLRPGAGPRLREAMDGLISQTRERLPAAFEADAYDSARDALITDLQTRHDAALAQVQAQAAPAGFALTQTATGLDIVPLDPRHAHDGRRGDWSAAGSATRSMTRCAMCAKPNARPACRSRGSTPMWLNP